MEPTVYLNGHWFKRSEAQVSILDQGLLRGDGLFETIRIWKGEIPLLQGHLERLYRGAEFAEIAIPVTPEKMRVILKEIVKRNQLREGRIRVVVTRGSGDSMDPMPAELSTLVPTFFVLAEPLPQKPTPDVYENGVSIITVPVFVYNQLFPVNIKTVSYFHNMAAKRFARSQGAFDAILTDPQGNCTEGTTANLFWVENKKVYSPPLNVGALPGVTRLTLLGVLEAHGEKLHERNIHRRELKDAQEIFLTSSILGVLPVTKVDSHVVGRTIGPITQNIREQFTQVLDRLAHE